MPDNRLPHSVSGDNCDTPVPTKANGAPAPPAASITLCLGSSCFSRGNSRNLEVVRNFVKSQPAPPRVELGGHLCAGHCKSGPNITINGKLYHEVNSKAFIALLNQLLPKRGRAAVKGSPGTGAPRQ